MVLKQEEARGGACRSEVVISDEPIHYPLIEEADILVAMSQEALDKQSLNRRG